jgi:hypothetical protein
VYLFCQILKGITTKDENSNPVSKRKRKGQLEKYQELSGTFLNISKRNKDARVCDEGFNENTSGGQSVIKYDSSDDIVEY